MKRLLAALLLLLPAAASDPSAEYASKAAKLAEKGPAKAWLELADFAERNLLAQEREDALRKALDRDPAQAQAQARLGNRLLDGAWIPAGEADAKEAGAMEAKGLVLYGTKWIPAKEAGKARDADRQALGWPVETRIDLPGLVLYSGRDLAFTRKAAALLADAAEAYRRFYGRTWKLPAQPKPLKAFLLPDRGTFLSVYGRDHKQAPSDDASGVYSVKTGVLYVGMREGDRPGDHEENVLMTAVHEMLHGLDHQWCGVGPRDVPLWITEGRAHHFGYSARGRLVLPGLMSVPEGDGLAEAMEASLGSLPLADLLGMDAKAFYGRSRETYALAAAFVHFLLHADGGKRAAGFHKFLSGLPGKSSRSDLEAALGEKAPALQSAFQDYVRKALIPAITAPR